MSGHIKDMVSQHWNTPQRILEAVREVFGGDIDLDPCDNEHSLTSPLVSYNGKNVDGLKADWAMESYNLNKRINIYCNPPFGRSSDGTSVADWVKKCVEAMESPVVNSTILLLPASTETTFWHEHIWPTADAICFIKGRVSFLLDGKMSGASTKGTAIIYWGTNVEVFIERFSELGRAIRL